jgi:hypothetical protein
LCLLGKCSVTWATPSAPFPSLELVFQIGSC